MASRDGRPVYERILAEFGQDALTRNRKKGWMSSFDTVETAVYDREDGHRTIYAVNTDWWSPERMQAQTDLFLGDVRYTIDISRDKISVTTILGDIAVVTSDMETDVLEIYPETDGFSIHLQGGEFSCFRIYAPYPVTSAGFKKKSEVFLLQSFTYTSGGVMSIILFN